MKPAELKVITEAVRWWKRKRPIEWNEKLHLENETVNCHTEADGRLAEAVKRLIQSK